MRLTVADEAVLPLEAHVSPTRTIDNLAELAIRRIGQVGPQSRFVLLDEETLNALETRLGSTVIGTPKDLLAAVENLADVKIEGISLRFSPPQLKEIKDRADREAMTPTEWARRVVYAMIPQFFKTAPAQMPPDLAGAKGR